MIKQSEALSDDLKPKHKKTINRTTINSNRPYLALLSLCKSLYTGSRKGKRKVQGVPQSQTTALPRHQEEEETDKTKQAQIEQTYEKH